MAEFEVSGQTYRSGKLSAFKQLHVARKIAPLFARAGAANDGAGLIPISMADAFANMSDADVEYVAKTCMEVVRRKQDGGRGWAGVFNVGADKIMFEDIDLMTMLQISVHVIQESIGPFGDALAQIFPAPPLPAQPASNGSDSPEERTG